jgi:beta-phosphoglucomutase-like phosphatase (HAD superfamily)
MISKVAPAMSRVLDPIKPTERPGQSISFSKSHESNEGGHGALGYETLNQQASEGPGPDEKKAKEAEESNEEETPKVSSLPFQPGLTQVILDLSSQRLGMVSGSAYRRYKEGPKKEELANPTKGSNLDKKAS